MVATRFMQAQGSRSAKSKMRKTPTGTMSQVRYWSLRVSARTSAESALAAVAVDGKTVRRVIGSEGNQTNLLAPATHGKQLVLGQVEVGAKSNEIHMFTPLLDGLTAVGVDLQGGLFTQ